MGKREGGREGKRKGGRARTDCEAQHTHIVGIEDSMREPDALPVGDEGRGGLNYLSVEGEVLLGLRGREGGRERGREGGRRTCVTNFRLEIGWGVK